MDNSEWGYMEYIERREISDLRNIMNAYGQDVWNLAYLLTRRYDLADDIAQEVFLKAYVTANTFRGDASIKTWLLSITRNTSINYIRTAFMRKVTLMEWVYSREVSASAEQDAMANSLSSDIWQAVLELPIKMREVLILHAKYEMTTKEIATMLMLSEGTVKSRLSRARSRMSVYRKGSATYE